MTSLEQRINALADSSERSRISRHLDLLTEFRQALNRGDARVVEPVENAWNVNAWVKKGILLHLGLGELTDSGGGGRMFEFDTLPRRRFSEAERIRVTAESAVIRDGTFLAPGVTCMSPCFINMGVQVGADSVLDANSMVGLCAFVGERVHIGPGVQIGGLITPMEALPTIIGDDVVVGGNSGIYDGVSVGAGAVLLPGTILGSHTRLYDLPRKMIYKATPSQPLIVPPMAVVGPGGVPLTQVPGAGDGVTLQAALITAYRDDPAFNGDPYAALLS